MTAVLLLAIAAGAVDCGALSGGPVPAFYLRIAPTVGLRFKPTRDIEARLQFGYSLTEGFYFGLSANYRMPYSGKVGGAPAAAPPSESRQ